MYTQYRGWKISGNVAWRGGTTIYGDNKVDLKRRIDAYMAN